MYPRVQRRILIRESAVQIPDLIQTNFAEGQLVSKKEEVSEE